MYLLSIIIATRNSALYIRETLSEVVKGIDTYSQQTEIIVVNDGNDNAVKSQVLGFKEDFNTLTYISLSKPSGQQLAIRAGMQMAKGQYLVTFDDDLQYRAEDIPKLLAQILLHPHLKIVCGYSETREHRGIYSLISKLTVFLLEQIFFRKFRDAHYFTSLKIFERSIVESPDGCRNIYFFWEFNPKEIGFIKVSHFKRSAGYTGYSLLAYLKFFRHIILKMAIGGCMAFLPLWVLMSWWFLSETAIIAGALSTVMIALFSSIYLSFLKHQVAEIGEVIR